MCHLCDIDIHEYYIHIAFLNDELFTVMCNREDLCERHEQIIRDFEEEENDNENF